jgi:beta-glucanase (GH16 family)
MIKIRYKVSFILFSTLSFFTTFGQVASCVHGGGIPYLLDAFLGSVGACNCELSPVQLYTFPGCNADPYVIEFEDDFNGSGLDTAKWQIQPWGQGALENSVYMEVNLLENVSVSNGICSIIAKKETVLKRAVNWRGDTDTLDDGLPNLRTYYYTSSNLWTKEKFFHGKYEIRCRMPKGNGFWPAFWMFGGKRWNEIDVFDSYSGTTKLITSIGHDFDGTGKSNGCNSTKRGFDLSEWHTYSCIFEFDKITFLVDEEIVRVVNRFMTANNQPLSCGDHISTGTYFQLKSFPIEKMNIIINLALIKENQTGSFIPVDASTPFPSSLEIDFVRKWKRKPVVDSLAVTPNPTSGMIEVKCNVAVSCIEIYDLTGSMIYQSKMPDLSEPINMGSHPNGIYILKVNMEHGIKTVKFIKSAK